MPWSQTTLMDQRRSCVCQVVQFREGHGFRLIGTDGDLSTAARVRRLSRTRSALRWISRFTASRGQSQQLLLLLCKQHHVEIAAILQPRLVGLGAQRQNQPQAGVGVGEDAHDPGAALDLLV
jgi:hypothetical protein